MRTTILACILFIVIASFYSCGDTPADIEGTWNLVYFESNGIAETREDGVHTQTELYNSVGSDFNFETTFSEDGSQFGSGTYTIGFEHIFLSEPSMDTIFYEAESFEIVDSPEGTYTFDGTTLTIFGETIEDEVEYTVTTLTSDQLIFKLSHSELDTSGITSVNAEVEGEVRYER